MNYSAEYQIGKNGVSKSLLFIEETLKTLRVKQRDLMEALLISEETMTLLSEHAPEGASIQINVSRRMGVPRIRLVVPGTPLTLGDHLETVSIDQLGTETEAAIRNVMLRSYADSIKYRHSRKDNILTIVIGVPERMLATYTVLAGIFALFTALLFSQFLPDGSAQWLSVNLLSPLESLFISALMCIAAPAVFFSITCSMFRFDGITELERTGKTVLLAYFWTSVAATLIGMFVFELFLPGEAGLLAEQAGSGTAEGFSPLTILATLIPPNIVEPLVSVNSLQLTAVAAIVGSALTMCGKRVRHLKILIEEMDVVCGKVSSMLMDTVPLFVYCSTLNVLITHPVLMNSAVELVITLAVGLVLLMVMYFVMLLVVARLDPFPFFRKYMPATKSVFIKGSNIAAVPLNMRISRRQLGVPQSVSSFSIPLGATINMDGNCMCLICITLFFVRICGVAFGTNEIIVLLLMVLILSLGAPIAPGTLILCLVTLLKQMGVDISVISMVIGINFVLEMLLGAVNSVGDMAIALLAAKLEGSLDLAVYRKK